MNDNLWATKWNWPAWTCVTRAFGLSSRAGGAAFGFDPPRGIQEPLEGVEVQQTQVLLNGFKRYRCARRLRLATVPFSSLGGDEATAILGLLKLSNNRTLSILEQAAFIAELKTRAASTWRRSPPSSLAANPGSRCAWDSWPR